MDVFIHAFIQGCGTAFQLVLDKQTSAMNSLSGNWRLICLCAEIGAHCDHYK